MRWFAAVLPLLVVISACVGVTAPPSPSPGGAPKATAPARAVVASVQPATPTAGASLRPSPSASPSATHGTPDPTPAGDGLTVQWQPADLDLTGVDRAIVTGIVRLPAGGYLAWGHGQSDSLGGGDIGELYWRSDDGRLWERTAASGPAHLSAADSSPLGIVAIAGGEAWWSEDGNRWQGATSNLRAASRIFGMWRSAKRRPSWWAQGVRGSRVMAFGGSPSRVSGWTPAGSMPSM